MAIVYGSTEHVTALALYLCLTLTVRKYRTQHYSKEQGVSTSFTTTMGLLRFLPVGELQLCRWIAFLNTFPGRTTTPTYRCSYKRVLVGSYVCASLPQLFGAGH